MLMDGRTTVAGVVGILIVHLGAFGSGELLVILDIKYLFFFYFTENYSRRVRKSTDKIFLALI